jgi:hypothetical protein
VQSTITADGLTVDGLLELGGSASGLVTGDANPHIFRTTLSGDYVFGDLVIQGRSDTGGRGIYLATGATPANRIKVADTGDISFYEDTGTTAKFFWDANEEALRIGSYNGGGNPSGSLFVESNANNHAIHIEETGGNSESWQIGVDTDGDLGFYNSTSATASVTFDDSGNVGIGTSSPATHGLVDGLVIGDGTSNQGITLFGSTTSQQNIAFTDIAGDQRGLLQYDHSSDAMRFFTSATEAMRIDSSGRVGIGGVPNINWRNDIADQEVLMLGTEATFFSDTGVTTELWNNAYVDNSDTFKNISTRGASRYYQYQGAHKWFTAASASAGSTITTEINTTPKMILDVSGNLLVNRSSAFTTAKTEIQSDAGDPLTLALNSIDSDGNILSFYKAGTTVGSIASRAGVVTSLVLDPRGSGAGLTADTRKILPSTETGATNDGLVDLGRSAGRFKDLYLSGGVYLGGTGSANKLDDYETGTWTPVVRGGTTAGTFSGGTADGRYIKIGEMITLMCYIDSASLSGAAGIVEILGNPFTSAGSSLPANAVAAGRHSSITLSANAVTLNAVNVNNNTLITLRESYDDGTAASILDASQIGSSFGVVFSLTFRAA